MPGARSGHRQAAPCPGSDLGAFATARWTDFSAPFFAEGEGRVDEGFTEIDLAAVPEVLGEALQQPIEAALSAARVESDDGKSGTADSAMAGRATARPCAGPTYAVHDGPRIGPRPAAPIRATARAKVGSSTAHWTSVRCMPSGPRRSYRCFPLMQPGCQGNCSLRCGRQNGHAPSTSNRPPTTMNTRVTEMPARKCGSV